MKWEIHPIRSTVVLLFVLLLLPGCRSELFPKTLRVGPGIVQEVRSIGKVLLEKTDEDTWDGITTVTEILVIDVGSLRAREALEKAGNLLRERGWVISAQRLPDWVQMESGEWENVLLSIEGLEFYDSTEGLGPKERKAVNDPGGQVMSEGVVILKLSRTNE
ncbi:hypothetical protein [Sphaerimonospora mesophila]|uniref:hypothetical protein n=1 Tax=Sphaerimonospora mesophila TaxID=37483 RepID=UPI00128F1EEB